MDYVKEQSANEEILQLVSFKLGTEEYGVNILQVQEINRMTEITRVPNTPTYVEGVINLRGKVIPIIDLRKRLQMPSKEYDTSTRIIVVELVDKVLGFIVDSVSEVLRISSNVVVEPPPGVSATKSDYITGVGKLENRLIILLDLEKTLSHEEQTSLQEVLEQ